MASEMANRTDKDMPGKDERRRGVIRTALILGAVVLGIYLFFVGRGVFNYFLT